MKGEFKLKTGGLIFINSLLGGSILVLIGILCRQFFPDYAFPVDLFYGILSVFLILITFCIIGILDAYKSRLIIDDHSIRLQALFALRELNFHDILGVRLIKGIIYIIPTKGKKQIRVNYLYEQEAAIYNWLVEQFGDIDEKEAKTEKDEIIHNDAFGIDQEERNIRLAKAKRLAKILNWAGGLTAAWLLFIPTPYKIAIATTLIYFPLSLIVLKINKGLIRLNDQKSSGYPSIGFGIMLNIFALIIRALSDNELMEYSSIWYWTTGLSILIISSYIIDYKGILDSDKKKRYELFLVITAIGIYSYSAIIAINSTFDNSSYQVFQAKVIDKRIITGKTTSYCIQIGTWGSCTNAKEVNVNEDFYNACTKESIVDVYYMNGLLNIPWFEVHLRK